MMEAAAWAVTLMLAIVAMLLVLAWFDDNTDDDYDPWEDGGI